MARKPKHLAAALAACLFFSGCSGFGQSTEDLMQPPRLNAEQKAVDDALKATIETQYSLKYPKSGDYRSAFVFHDLDGDGEDEALAFYSIGLSTTTRVVPLDKEGGVWRAKGELSGANQEVEFIAFANLSSPDYEDVLIGWSSEGQSEKQMELYTYTGGGLRKLIFRDNSLKTGFNYYDSYLVDDMDGDGRDDLFLFSRDERNRQESSWIKQFSYDPELDAVRLIREHTLTESIVQFAGITVGRLDKSSGKRGIFIDELLYGDQLATEVFALDHNGAIEPVISVSMSGAPEDGGPTLYERALRDLGFPNKDITKATVCSDINGDTVIEIPTARLMPGYENRTDLDPIYLTEYVQIDHGGFTRVLATAINRTGGYRVDFTDDWIDQVTAYAIPESGEWRFLEYNPSLKDPFSDVAGELLRVRVVSKKGYQDKELEKYSKLDTRGLFTYYAYLPQDVKSDLAVGPYQLSKENPNRIFSLL